REVAERAEPGLDTTPQQSLVDRVLVVSAGKDRERPDGSRVREEAHRHQEEPLDHDVEEEGEYHQNAEQSRDTDVRPAQLGTAHHPTSEHRADEYPPRVAGGVHEERLRHHSTGLAPRNPTRHIQYPRTSVPHPGVVGGPGVEIVQQRILEEYQ